MNLQEKITDAEKTIQLAADMSEFYYHKPLIICYSGGKDSDVMLDITKRCLKPEQFEVLNSHTTVDAPETVYHIRDVFRELEAEGIKTEIRMPRYKGQPTSMWKLIEKEGMPPTRLQRYCCKFLKEATTPNRMIAVGVREDESYGRKGRDTFSVRAKRKEDAEYRSTQHTYAMFKLDQLDQDTYECQIIKACKANRDTIVNPIYKFTEQDVWDYANGRNIKMNPLYKKGYKRIGCIGCPLGGAKNQQRDFINYPKYKDNYIKAFERMIKRKKERKLAKKQPLTDWDNYTGEQIYNWWIGEDPKQIRIDDIIGQ